MNAPNTARTRRVGVCALSSGFLRLILFLAGRLHRPRLSAGIPLGFALGTMPQTIR